jgi:Fumarase C C-terminus
MATGEQITSYKTCFRIADKDLTLKAAALELGFVTEAEFDRIVDPTKMVNGKLLGSIAVLPDQMESDRTNAKRGTELLQHPSPAT